MIYNRADSEKEFMGLTTFTGDFPTKKKILQLQKIIFQKLN